MSRDRACTGHGSLVTHSQVINTAGLHNDYTFLSGLQAQEIQLGSPDRFLREWCGLSTRLSLACLGFSTEQLYIEDLPFRGSYLE